MQKGTATLEDSLKVSYRTRYILTMWSNDHIPWYLFREVEDLYLHKNVHMDVYNCFISNCQNVKVTKMAFSRWMDLWYFQKMECYCALRRNIYHSKNTGMNLKFILRSQRSQSEKTPYCMIPTLWHSGESKTMKAVKRLVVPNDWGEAKIERHRGFLEQWNYSMWYFKFV